MNRKSRFARAQPFSLGPGDTTEENYYYIFFCRGWIGTERRRTAAKAISINWICLRRKVREFEYLAHNIRFKCAREIRVNRDINLVLIFLSTSWSKGNIIIVLRRRSFWILIKIKKKMFSKKILGLSIYIIKEKIVSNWKASIILQ